MAPAWSSARKGEVSVGSFAPLRRGCASEWSCGVGDHGQRGRPVRAHGRRACIPHDREAVTPDQGGGDGLGDKLTAGSDSPSNLICRL
jgi:hypothetical protein